MIAHDVHFGVEGALMAWGVMFHLNRASFASVGLQPDGYATPSIIGLIPLILYPHPIRCLIAKSWHSTNMDAFCSICCNIHLDKETTDGPEPVYRCVQPQASASAAKSPVRAVNSGCRVFSGFFTIQVSKMLTVLAVPKSAKHI